MSIETIVIKLFFNNIIILFKTQFVQLVHLDMYQPILGSKNKIFRMKS